jgi:hypothetical protein
MPANPYQFPPLDLSPSCLLGGKVTTRKAIKIFSITGAIGVISGLFTILGINIFDLKKYFPFSFFVDRPILSWCVIAVIASVIIVSFTELVQALVIRQVNFVRCIRTAWVSIADKIYTLHFKRVCPYSHCGGIMEPKRVTSTEDKNKLTWMWICQGNPDLHKVDYDSTQVDRAINDGALDFLFHNLPP